MIADPYCWHRPGLRIRSGVLCRHCGVLIDWCPCAGEYFRHVEPDCSCCRGSQWAAVVRGRRSKFVELMLEDAPEWSDVMRKPEQRGPLRRLVVHCKAEPFDVYIGRPGPWGNPYSHKSGTLAQFKVSSIDEALYRYREWLLSQPELVERAKRELNGKVLGCWCKHPKHPESPCHGDVLVEVANS